MGNQNARELSQAEIGRRPTDEEMLVLFTLQKKLFTRLVQSPEHLALLKRYWESHFVNKQNTLPFEMVSPFWCTEAGFSTEKPGQELRMMGELGLHCLVYFSEQYPGESRMMKRAKGGYPFVKAAMAVGRALSEALHLVDETGGRGKFPVVETLYWQILRNEESFYKLFSLCFLVFEELYCERVASDRTVPVTERIPISLVAELVDETKAKLLTQLQQAPLNLDDLGSLCVNGNHIFARRDCSGGARKTSDALSSNKITAMRTRSASTPMTSGGSSSSAGSDRLAQWKQHQTARKSMRSAAKTWDHAGDAGGVAPRLTPRPPEVTTTRATSEPIDASDKDLAAVGDLFAGLVTKEPPAIARAS